MLTAAAASALIISLTRLTVSGVFLHVREVSGKKPVLAAVGTTGMILILATIPMPAGAENMPGREGHSPGVILSAETVNSVLRLFRGAEEVQVIVNSASIYFNTDNVRYCSAMHGRHASRDCRGDGA